MKTKYLSLIVVGLIFFIAACKKNSLPVATHKTPLSTSVDTSVDVYVAGYVVGSNIINTRAAYWKNGILTISLATAFQCL